MASFKYYLPQLADHELAGGDDKLRRDVLARYGLASSLADCVLARRDVALSQVHRDGPDGLSGLLLTPTQAGEPPASVQYRPGKQRWLPPVPGGAWIGWELEAPPTPADLARREQLAGHTLLDAAGNAWKIPIARAPGLPYGLLPQSYTFSSAGEPIGHLRADCDELWERAGQIWEVYAWHYGQQAIADGAAVAVREPPADWLSATWLLRQAVWLLGVNYRVGVAEINALFEAGLALLDDAFKHAICQAVCDFDFLTELQKKTKPGGSDPVNAGSNSTPGDAAGMPVIDPASRDSISPA